MKRNLKALGLSLVAVFALSAVAASSAQAANHHLTVPTKPAIITATDEASPNNPKLSIGGGESITCPESHYRGTVKENTNTEVTIVPEYTNCHTGGGAIPVEVTVNHCAYVLTGETDANEHAEVHIECADKEPGVPTEITVSFTIFGSNCTYHFGPQTVKGVHYTQTKNTATEKQDVTVKLTVTKIKYKRTAGSFLCPGSGTSGEDGELTGAITAQAYEEKAGCKELEGTEKTTPKTKLDECQGAVQNLELTTT